MFYSEISRAQKAFESVEKRMNKELADAPEDKRHQIYSAWRDLAVEPVEQQYRLLLTRHWTRKARGKFIEVPSVSENEGHWEDTMPGRQWVLTDKGISHLRSAIREESRAGSEGYFRWAAITLGLMAVVAPILSVVVVTLVVD